MDDLWEYVSTRRRRVRLVRRLCSTTIPVLVGIGFWSFLIFGGWPVVPKLKNKLLDLWDPSRDHESGFPVEMKKKLDQFKSRVDDFYVERGNSDVGVVTRQRRAFRPGDSFHPTFYPDKSNLRNWISGPVFATEDAARRWILSIGTQYPGYDWTYEIGLNCQPLILFGRRREGEEVCEETFQ